MYQPLHKSIVRDYNVAQGVTHPSDLTTHIIRDINMRYVTVENSSNRSGIGIAVADSWDMHPVPPRNFVLAKGEIRHIGINTMGEKMQYIHILDLKTGKHVGAPYPFRTDANQFVLRDGINMWWVNPFKRPSYNAAH
jgi:hypothetical protein